MTKQIEKMNKKYQKLYSFIKDNENVYSFKYPSKYARLAYLRKYIPNAGNGGNALLNYANGFTQLDSIWKAIYVPMLLQDFTTITNLEAMAEQRLAEIYEMGYESVEEWYDTETKRIPSLLFHGQLFDFIEYC